MKFHLYILYLIIINFPLLTPFNKKAAEKERELICQAFDACNIMQEKINFSLNEISEATLILNESAEKCKSDISHFYIEIRKMLEERENQLKFKSSSSWPLSLEINDQSVVNEMLKYAGRSIFD